MSESKSSDVVVRTRRRGIRGNVREKQTQPEDVDDTASLFKFSDPASVKEIAADDFVEDVPPVKTTRCKKRRVERRDSDDIVISSDESGTDLASSSLVSSRIPSPGLPPTPPQPIITKKQAKNKYKGIKTALTKLNRAKTKYEKQTLLERDVTIVEETPAVLSPNDNVMLVKIRSRSGIQRFPMTMTDSFDTVRRQMASHEGVDEKQVVMYLGDVTVQPYDSPTSLKLHVADIIECHIRGKRVSLEGALPVATAAAGPNSVLLRIQADDPKTRIETHVHKNEPLEKIFRVFAKQHNKLYSELQFCFDGDVIAKKATAQSLDLEDGFCIDVIGM